MLKMCHTGSISSRYLDARQPLSDSSEAVLGCDVVHHHHAVSLSKELFGDASKPAAGGGR